MEKIEVRNTSIVINNYKMGDNYNLENIFKVFDPIYHRFNTFGLYYDEDNKKLYLPSGLDIWKIKSYFNEKYYDRIYNHKYKSINKNIGIKYRPRDKQQEEALRFMCGINEYKDNLNANQLEVNLNTGKGKTYCSIATICYFKIKSIIITGSTTLLSQWKDEIIKYTNLNDKDVLNISGSNMVNMILSGKSKRADDANVYLCTHGTLRSYGDKYGWYNVYKLFKNLGIGLKFFDEAHTNFENMQMIDFFTNVYKTYYVTATPGRSDWRENNIYQLSIKNIPSIDLFDPDNDPHTDYVAIKWNSKPSPIDRKKCRGRYGLDRMKYISYLSRNPEFYKLLTIVMELVIKCNGRVLIYIGTNECILLVYQWICKYYPEFIGDIGIFTSLLSKKDKLIEKNKKILLSTTKSAGLGEHIEGLKMTIVLAEPFASKIIARQTLGRTRDNDTMYIEFVDVAFNDTTKYYYKKIDTIKKYALSVSDSFMSQNELNNKYNNISEKRYKPNIISPLILKDDRFDLPELDHNNIYNSKDPLIFF